MPLLLERLKVVADPFLVDSLLKLDAGPREQVLSQLAALEDAASATWLIS